jgi:hypothetical protein
MIDRAEETRRFQARIADIGSRLASRGVVVQAEDHPEAFGSWDILAGTPLKKLYFEYEGKESYLRYRDASVTPKGHHDFEHKTFRTWEGEDPLAYVEEVLGREFAQALPDDGANAFPSCVYVLFDYPPLIPVQARSRKA